MLKIAGGIFLGVTASAVTLVAGSLYLASIAGEKLGEAAAVHLAESAFVDDLERYRACILSGHGDAIDIVGNCRFEYQRLAVSPTFFDEWQILMEDARVAQIILDFDKATGVR